MKVINKYNQMRRDCSVDLECEECKAKKIFNSAHDDRNFWDNVIPNLKCNSCGKSTKDLGLDIKFIETKYRAGEHIQPKKSNNG